MNAVDLMLDRQRRVWKSQNKGLMKRIATRMKCSRSFVSDVFYGRKRSLAGDIERILSEAGAPGVQKP